MFFEFTIYLFVSIIGCILYYKWAHKNAIVDAPNERSSHTHQPVRGMGVVFPILFVLASFYVWIRPNYLDSKLVSDLIPVLNTGPMYLGIAILIAGITGFVDDRINLKSIIRLPLYLLAVCVSMLPVLNAWSYSIFWLFIIVVFIVGIINTYNFMDGINGITGFYTLVLLGSSLYMFLNIEIHHILTLDIFSLTKLAIAFFVAFGIFNYRKKALAFIGDAGSVSIGLFVCILLVWLGMTIERWEVIILLLVYGVDSVGTIILRLLRKENIFEAHRSHLYQDLVHVKKWSHIQVALTYAILQLAINIAYIQFFDKGPMVLMYALVGLIVLYLVSKKQLGTLTFTSD